MTFNEFDLEYIRSIITCDFENGKCYWKSREVITKYDKSWNSRYENKEITAISEGYIVLRFTYQKEVYRIKLHRVIYALYNNKWPNYILDHKDGNKLNNKISNLIPSNKSENGRNSKAKSESGYKGISECKRTGKWYYRLHVNGKTIKGKRYDDIENAIADRDAARLLHNYPPARDSKFLE